MDGKGSRNCDIGEKGRLGHRCHPRYPLSNDHSLTFFVEGSKEK